MTDTATPHASRSTSAADQLDSFGGINLEEFGISADILPELVAAAHPASQPPASTPHSVSTSAAGEATAAAPTLTAVDFDEFFDAQSKPAAAAKPYRGAFAAAPQVEAPPPARALVEHSGLLDECIDRDFLDIEVSSEYSSRKFSGGRPRLKSYLEI